MLPDKILEKKNVEHFYNKIKHFSCNEVTVTKETNVLQDVYSFKESWLICINNFLSIHSYLLFKVVRFSHIFNYEYWGTFHSSPVMSLNWQCGRSNVILI